MIPIIRLPLRVRRDLLAARQRARQIASLLRFDTHEQACIAAGAFAVALQAWEQMSPACLTVRIDAGKLEMFASKLDEKEGAVVEPAEREPATPPAPTVMLRLSKPLPAAAGQFADEDLGFILRQLTEHTPVDMFEEIRQQNQEVLQLLHALRQAEASILAPSGQSSRPSAA